MRRAEESRRRGINAVPFPKSMIAVFENLTQAVTENIKSVAVAVIAPQERIDCDALRAPRWHSPLFALTGSVPRPAIRYCLASASRGSVAPEKYQPRQDFAPATIAATRIPRPTARMCCPHASTIAAPLSAASGRSCLLLLVDKPEKTLPWIELGGVTNSGDDSG